MVNSGVDGSGQEQPSLRATITESFRSSLIDKADDWVVAVERFEININGIPYYPTQAGPADPLTGARTVTETIIIRNLAGVVLETLFLTRSGFSIQDIVRKLNEDVVDANPLIGGGGAALNVVSFSIDHEGFVRFKFDATWLGLFQLDLSNCPRLNAILGLETVDQFTIPAGVLELISRCPRWDTGDDLDHLRITSNLPTVSDSVGQSKSNILTDLSFLEGIGAGFSYTGNLGTAANPPITSASYSQRQKVVYNPSERRYLNLRSSSPIDEIILECEFVKQDGTSQPVLLPRGAVFNIKLAFFSRS